MAQLIDKSALVAEIKRRLWLLVPKVTFYQQRAELEKLLSYIDTLEVKEVDFEKIWKEYFKYKGDVATVNVKHLAKHFFELGLKAQKGE